MQDKDSLGNILTQEQVEFFKNSKVRDSSNNLLVCYHFTNKEFDTFKYYKNARNGRLNFGKAFYFTNIAGDENVRGYGSIRKDCYLNLVNPLIVDAKGTGVKERPTNFDGYRNGYVPEGDPTWHKEWYKYMKDNNLILQDYAYELYFHKAKKQGNDGIIIYNVADYSGSQSSNYSTLMTVYVAFKENQIKSIGNKNPSKSNNINEEVLFEKTRQDLISKSKSGKNYSSKNQAKGKNRWERRRYSQIANSVRDYNDINMDAFWKGDILDFKIKVKGETDNYIISITFEKILDELQREVRANNNKLEFKCVLRALLKAFNGEDVYMSCSCPDWNYRFAHNATVDRYNAGVPEMRPNRFLWTNSQDDMGAGCKHTNLVLSNTDWMMKVASVINNYIKWTKENMERNYADYIFPKVYGMPYNRAVQLSLFDDPEDNGLLPSDQETITKVIDKSLQGKDEKGRWVKDNEFRFQKKDSNKYPEDNDNQIKLNFEKEQNKRLKQPEEEEEIEIETEEEKERNDRYQQ